MPEFNCYENSSSSYSPMLRPWPACGVVKRPISVYGTVTFSGTVAGVCPYANGTYNMTWTLEHECSIMYFPPPNTVPVSVSLGLPGFTWRQYASSGGFIGFQTAPYVIVEQNNGSCVWNNTTGLWAFQGSMKGVLQVGNQTCTMWVNITGIG